MSFVLSSRRFPERHHSLKKYAASNTYQGGSSRQAEQLREMPPFDKKIRETRRLLLVLSLTGTLPPGIFREYHLQARTLYSSCKVVCIPLASSTLEYAYMHVLITTRSMHTLHTVALVHTELECGGALAVIGAEELVPVSLSVSGQRSAVSGQRSAVSGQHVS